MTKIDFFSNLLRRLNCEDALLDFMVREKIVTPHDGLYARRDMSSVELPVWFLSTLEDAVKIEKIQLLDYEWTVLPKEHLKLTIVTNMDKIELAWDAM